MRAMPWVMIIFLPWTGQILCHGGDKCLAIIKPDFHDCKRLSHPDHTDGHCSDAYVCNKHFKFLNIDVDPFVEILQDVIYNTMMICCGSCKNVSQYPVRVVNVTKLSRPLVNTSNFVFPVLGLYTENSIFGYHYIPILELSSGYYIARKRTAQQDMQLLIRSCLNLWPLLVIVLLLSLIAGFVMWLSETWYNKEQFPRMFFVGLFDGFWWSFVSMTTVGYGDKSPKFIISRLFSVFWILVGIAICSMFTASLTTEIASTTKPNTPNIHRKNVGVLRYRTFDAAVVAKHGGLIRETKGRSYEEDLVELKHMLSDADSGVSGIFLDKYTLMHIIGYANEIRNGHEHTYADSAEAATFFLEGTRKVKHILEGERMSYGILVTEEEDFQFFNEFIKHNRAVYETCALLNMNHVDDSELDEVHDLFSTDGGHFYPFLIITLSVVGGILLFGIVFEICRRKNQIASDATST